MQLRKWFQNWDLNKLSIKTPILNMEWTPETADQDAAWDMYVELLTRITTQPLDDKDGVEQTALSSVHALFGLTREVIKSHGRDCAGFARVAIIILNQVIRPFTAKWHRLSEAGAFGDSAHCLAFRNELRDLQEELREYTRMLGRIAEVEDLSELQGQSTRVEYKLKR